VTIALPAEIELRLESEASRQGIATEEYVKQLILHHLPSPSQAASSVKILFDRWQEEDRTDDPAELARRQQEFEQFKEAMNRNRLEMEGPNSRKPF
jgi:hypothetical protein